MRFLLVLVLAGCSGRAAQSDNSAQGDRQQSFGDVSTSPVTEPEPITTNRILKSSGVTDTRPPVGRPVRVSLDQLWAELKETKALADAAVEVETNRCLEGSGFVYHTPAWPIEFRTGTIGTPWRFSDDAESETLSTEAASSSAEDDSLEPAFAQLLYGNVVGEWQRDLGDTPVEFAQAAGGEIYDGCLPIAQRNIIGGGEQERSFQLVDFAYLLTGIERLAISSVLTSDEYQRAHERWQTCIEELGYSIVRFEPDNSVLTQPPPLTTSEIGAADDCSNQVGLATTGDELLSTEIQSVWDSQLGFIEELRTSLGEVEARALKQ